MPADLKKPFSESCCDGGGCSDSKESTQPCGCDPGANYVSPYCVKHLLEQEMKEMGKEMLEKVRRLIEERKRDE